MFHIELGRSYGISLWKNIWARKQLARDCVDWKVGRGNKVLFWHDCWLGEEHVKDRFLQIYAIAQWKNMRVIDAVGRFTLARNGRLL